MADREERKEEEEEEEEEEREAWGEVSPPRMSVSGAAGGEPGRRHSSGVVPSVSELLSRLKAVHDEKHGDARRSRALSVDGGAAVAAAEAAADAGSVELAALEEHPAPAASVPPPPGGAENSPNASGTDTPTSSFGYDDDDDDDDDDDGESSASSDAGIASRAAATPAEAAMAVAAATGLSTSNLPGGGALTPRSRRRSRNSGKKGALFSRASCGVEVVDRAEQERAAERERQRRTDGLCGTVCLSTAMVAGARSFAGRVHDPRGTFRAYWDVAFVLMLVYNLIEIPYRVCFELWLRLSHPIMVINLLVDCFFLTDVVVNFRTGYYKRSGQLVTSPRRIARRYLRGWFWLDLFTSIPIDHIAIAIAGSSGTSSTSAVTSLPRALRIFRYARVFKLARIFKMFKVMSRWDANEGGVARLMRSVRLFATVFFLAHVSACIWMLTANLERDPGAGQFEFDPDSWPARTDVLAGRELSRGLLYLTSLYFAVATLTTIGYGDISPVTQSELAVSLLIMALGAVVFSYVVGNVSSVVSRAESEDPYQKALRQRWVRVSSLMERRRVPRSARRTVQRHFERILMAEGPADLHDLPPALRDDIVLCLYRHLIANVPFLKAMGRGPVELLVSRLRPVFVAAGQTVFRQGDAGSEMYVVDDGVAHMLLQETSEREVRLNLARGSYFGEASILCSAGEQHGVSARRPYTVRASAGTDLMLLALSRDDFTAVLLMFPEVRLKLASMAEDAWNTIGRDAPDDGVRRDAQGRAKLFRSWSVLGSTSPSARAAAGDTSSSSSGGEGDGRSRRRTSRGRRRQNTKGSDRVELMPKKGKRRRQRHEV